MINAYQSSQREVSIFMDPKGRAFFFPVFCSSSWSALQEHDHVNTPVPSKPDSSTLLRNLKVYIVSFFLITNTPGRVGFAGPDYRNHCLIVLPESVVPVNDTAENVDMTVYEAYEFVSLSVVHTLHMLFCFLLSVFFLLILPFFFLFFFFRNRGVSKIVPLYPEDTYVFIFEKKKQF